MSQKKGLNFQGSEEDGGGGTRRPRFPIHESNISWPVRLVNGVVASWPSGHNAKKREKLLPPPSYVIYRVGLTFLYQQTRGASIKYLVSDGQGFLVVM
jgi:hypothetical protein